MAIQVVTKLLAAGTVLRQVVALMALVERNKEPIPVKPRMRILMASLAGAAIVTTALVTSQSWAEPMRAAWRDHRGGPPMHGRALGMLVPTLLAQVDTDRNGRITSAELATFRNDRLAAFDVDKDGSLSLAEFGALMHDITRPVQVRAFQFLDANGDGAVSQAELARPTGMLIARLDRNGDGSLDRHVPPMLVPMLLDRIDQDHDGKITGAEITSFRDDRRAAFDADKDGSLGLEEFRSLWQDVTQPVQVRVFQFLDADGDRKVTAEELARPSDRLLARMDHRGGDRHEDRGPGGPRGPRQGPDRG